MTDRMARRGTRMVALLALLLVGGCEAVAPRSCTAQFVYGIVVTVDDRDSGEPVEEGLSGVTVKGGVSSEMEAFGNVLQGAGEDAGTHDVLVTAPGYESWSMDRIQVEDGECHVSSVRLTASLVPTTDM